VGYFFLCSLKAFRDVCRCLGNTCIPPICGCRQSNQIMSNIWWVLIWFDLRKDSTSWKNNKCGWDTCGSLPLSWRQDIRKDTGARTWAPNPYRTQSHESYEWAQTFCGASRSSHRSILYLFEFIILFLSTRPIVLSPIVCISLTKNRNELGNQGR